MGNNARMVALGSGGTCRVTLSLEMDRAHVNDILQLYTILEGDDHSYYDLEFRSFLSDLRYWLESIDDDALSEDDQSIVDAILGLLPASH